jgi:hypothetical protein
LFLYFNDFFRFFHLMITDKILIKLPLKSFKSGGVFEHEKSAFDFVKKLYVETKALFPINTRINPRYVI